MGKKREPKSTKPPPRLPPQDEKDREDLLALLRQHSGGISCMPTTRKVLGGLEDLVLETLSWAPTIKGISDQDRKVLTDALKVCAKMVALALAAAGADLERFTERLVAAEKPPH